MTQYNNLNVKLTNSQLNKLKSVKKKNGTEVTLKLSLNVAGDSNDDNDFPPKLLLTNTQVLRLCTTFANNSSANTKLLKTQLHKIGQSVGFLGRLLGPLIKTGLSLMKNVLKPLAKSVLIPLGLTAAASATDAAINMKRFGYDCHSDLASCKTTLIISNKEMNEIMKIIKFLEKSALLMKGLVKQLKMKQKNKKANF